MNQEPALPQHNRPASAAGPGDPPSLLKAKYVFVRQDYVQPPLSPLYSGPYLVLRPGPKFLKLQIGNKVDAVSVDRLKPCLHSGDVVPALPPRRGRPPLPPAPDPVPDPAPVRRPRGRPRKVIAQTLLLPQHRLGGSTVETLFRVYLMNLHVPCSTLSLSSYLSILLPRLSKPSIYTVHSIE